MVFKTFDNDLTGLINKVGLFNKSLYNIGRDFRNGNGFFTSFFSGQSVTSKDIQSINAMNQAMKNGSTMAQAWQMHMTGCTAAAKQQAKQCLINKGNLSDLTSKLNQNVISAKAGQVALQALATAGNMFAMWAISKGIELAVKGIDNLANASRHASESAKSLAASMNESLRSMSGNASTLSTLNEEYQELSKGVNNLGENISLSTDDYTRYKDIIDQVSSIMPNLTTYFNAQGEKIAFAKGRLSDLNEEYNKYIQNQAIEYVTKGDKDGNTVQSILDSYNSTKKLSVPEGLLKGLKNAFGFISTDDFTPAEIIHELEKLTSGENTSVKDIYKSLSEDMAEEAVPAVIGMNPGMNHSYALKYAIREELFKNMDRKDILSDSPEDYNAFIQKINSYIGDYNTKFSAGMNQIQAALLQEAYSKDEYWNIQDNDKKNDIITFLSSINSDVWDSLNYRTDHELSKFVSDIITCIDENKDGFADAWNGLFNPELKELPADKYVEKIDAFLNIIYKALKLDGENGIDFESFKADMGFTEADNTNKSFEESLHKIIRNEKYARLGTYQKEYDELLKFTETFTIEERELWLEATLGADGAAQAIEKYKARLAETARTEAGGPFTGFTEAQSKSIDDFQSKMQTLSTALSALRSGEDVGMTDLLQEFPELAGQSENLEDAIKNLIHDSLQKLYGILGTDLPTDVKENLQSIADTASGVSPDLNTAFASIQKSYDTMHEFKDAMDTGGLTESILSNVGSLSPYMNQLVAGFHAGAVSADELYQALTEHYHTDLENYGNALIAKNLMNEEFNNAV